MKGKILFKEEQSFTGTWIWYIMLGVSSLSVFGTALGLYMSPDLESITGLIIMAAITTSITILFYTCKIYLTIDQETIYYRYPPFVNREKTLSKVDVKDIYIRKYSALYEYGGWGYRISVRNGKAFNVAGDAGLQIVFPNDKKLLIGTQKPELLQTALDQLKRNWELKNG